MTDHKVEFRDLKTNQTVLTGSLADDTGHGVYKATFTPTLAGHFNMYIQFNGLDVDSSPYQVVVAPALTTSGAASTIVNLYSMSYKTGDYIAFVIESRD